MSNAKLVIMESPGGARVAQTRMVLDLIKRLADHGVTVIVISHNLNDMFEVAERIAILHLGHMVASGPASDFDSQVVVDFMTTGRSDRAAAGVATAAAAKS